MLMCLGYVISFLIGVGIVSTLTIYFTLKPWRFLPWKFWSFWS
jgi:hypothetical protein